MKPKQGMTERRIKTWLVRHLCETGEAKGAKVLSELCVAGFSRRVDVVLANGSLTAFEIKGEFDTLDRLPGQVETFSRYFEGVTVVCAPKHTSKVIAMVPEDIGVWEVNGDKMIVKRPPVVTHHLDRSVWLSYLPVRVLKGLLAEQTQKPAGPRRDQLVASAQSLGADVIRSAALSYLKSRGSNPSAMRIRLTPQNTVSNPVHAAERRIREFIELLNAAPAQIKAIPRKIREAA
jgi:hypothetical protein